MNVTSIKTHKITPEKDQDLFAVLDKYITKLEESSVVAVTSKIVAICEGRFIGMRKVDKRELIFEEADLVIPAEKNRYNVSLTIKNNLLIAGAGIDESNGNGFYILLPKNSQDSANKIREHLVKKFNLKNIGVIITDSRTTPLRWGVTGVALAHSGFKPLKDYAGNEDLFGRKFLFEKLNLADCLATTAVLVMGEGSEQTPLAIIEDVPFVEYQNRNPSKEELAQLKIDIKDDIYESLLINAPWEKGNKKVIND